MSEINKTAENYGLAQKLIPNSSFSSTYGQIYTSTYDSKGTLELIEQFKGKKIIGISGGHKKTFLFEEVDESENIVTALHPEAQDYLQYQGEQILSIDQLVNSLEGLRIIQIISGKTHNILRTQQGQIFSYGKGQFGSLGLGGCVFSSKPRLITKLNQKKIISIACGAFHSLALSQIGDLYSWGRGFQGQLGLLQKTQTASSPQYIPHFFKYNSNKDIKKLQKTPIHKIACGSYHSCAIDCDGNLYCWGQARYGQIGTGRKHKQPKPIKLDIELDGQKRSIKKVAGGYGHTLCLTEKGEIFGFGLNIKGQIGLNDLNQGMKSSENKIDYCKAVLYPKHIKQSRQCQSLPKFNDISCGFSRSFAIDTSGAVWAWGGGCLGFKERYSERGPTRLTEGIQNKQFAKIYANEDTLVLFASVSPTYFKPTLAPSKGGTEMTFFGTGFTHTGMQAVVFNLGTYSQLIAATYDEKTGTYFCKVPDFGAQKRYFQYPLECQISITLDGTQYYHYEKKLLVYSQKLSMENIEPKCGSAHGGTETKIYMPLHPLIQEYNDSITVGFKSNSKTDIQNKIQDWVCVEGTYSDDNIHCKLPNLPFFDNSDPFYLVDISLNGQQFTSHPQTIRFYLISDSTINPTEGDDNLQPEVSITAKGLFDTPFKKLVLYLDFTSAGQNYICQKPVQASWNKPQKKFSFKMPSLKWILGDINITEQLLTDARKVPISVRLNLSQFDPIEVGRYKFVIPPPPVQPEEQVNKKDSKKDNKKGAKK